MTWSSRASALVSRRVTKPITWSGRTSRIWPPQAGLATTATSVSSSSAART